jgi:hypothetical protein
MEQFSFTVTLTLAKGYEHHAPDSVRSDQIARSIVNAIDFIDDSNHPIYKIEAQSKEHPLAYQEIIRK